MKKLITTILTALALSCANALDIVSVNTNDHTLNRTDFSGSEVKFSDVTIKGTNIQTMLEEKMSTNKTITVNGETKNLNDNPTFTVEGGSGIDAPTATNIATSVVNSLAITTNKTITINGETLNLNDSPSFTVEGGTSNGWTNCPESVHWQWTSNGREITLTNYNFDTGGPIVFIPDMLDGLPVTTFTSNVFNGVTGPGTAITSIHGNNITTLPINAFRYSYSLESVSFPKLTYNTGLTFVQCTNLTSVYVPLLENLGLSDFLGCTKLETLYLPSVTNIGGFVFQSCLNLTSIYWSQNQPSYGTGIFNNIVVPPYVTNYVTNPTATGWGTYAFDAFFEMPVVRLPLYGNVNGNATSATTVTGTLSNTITTAVQPSTATNISLTVLAPYTNRITTAWQNPPEATNWLWSSDGKEITLTNYNFTTGSTDVVIPDYLDSLPVTTIGSRVFNSGSPSYTGTAITSIRGGKNLYDLLSYQFRNCTNLLTVDLPNVRKTNTSTFQGCTSLTTVTMPELTYIGNSAFNTCTSLTNALFPKVQTILDYSFYKTALSTIDMPLVTSIGESSFMTMTNLTSVNMYNLKIADAAAFAYCSNLVTVTMPQLTTMSETVVFKQCISLTNISLPSCTTIGANTFESCTNLITATLPEATTLGNSAFTKCYNLTTVYMPKVVTLGSYVFDDNYLLNSVYFSGNAPTVGTLVYRDATIVTNYVTNPNASGWGLTLGGMPVYRTAMAINSDTPVFDLSTIATGSTVNTVKVTRAMGMHLGILLTKNTVFEVDMSTFPTNSQCRFTMCINPATYTATYSTGFSAPITLTSNTWHTSYWLKGCYWSLFKGKVEVAP